MGNNKKAILLIIGFLCFAIFLVSTYFGYGFLASKYNGQNTSNKIEDKDFQNDTSITGTDKGKIKVKIKAVDFVVYDENSNEVKLSDYIGTPVVLNFWASWCPPCREEMPSFDEMSKKYSNDKIVILMVNLTDGQRETVDIAKQFIKDNNYNMKVLFDKKMDAANKYKISAIPRTIFIDRDGYIVEDNSGEITKKQLEREIKLLLE